MNKHVMVIGATGLVGREIVKLCLKNPNVETVQVFVRRESGLEEFDTASKLQEYIVDFNRVDDWSALLTGDTLFSAMGTTKSVAGTEEAQYQVDYQYQWDVARAARQNGCATYVLISASGANSESPFFYLRTKGELEDDVTLLGFPSLRILQPGLLHGERKEKRFGETAANILLSFSAKVLPRALFPAHLKPIPVETVAHAAVQAASKSHQGALVFGSAELWPLAERP